MSRYPRAARDAKIKCMECNAPVTETVDGGYACVDCGRNPFGDEARTESGESASGGRSLESASVGDAALDETSVDGDSTPDEEAGIDDGSRFEDDSGSRLGVGQ